MQLAGTARTEVPCVFFSIYPANELEHHADGEGQQDRHRGGEKQSDGGKGSQLLQNLLCVMHVSEGRYVIDCLVSSPPKKQYMAIIIVSEQCLRTLNKFNCFSMYRHFCLYRNKWQK